MLVYTSICVESRPQLVEMSTRRSTGQLATCVSTQVFQNNFGRFSSSCINSNCNCKNNYNCNGGLAVQWRRRQVEDLTFVTIALLMNCTSFPANCQWKIFTSIRLLPPVGESDEFHRVILAIFLKKNLEVWSHFFLVFQKEKSPRSLTWFTWKKNGPGKPEFQVNHLKLLCGYKVGPLLLVINGLIMMTPIKPFIGVITPLITGNRPTLNHQQLSHWGNIWTSTNASRARTNVVATQTLRKPGAAAGSRLTERHDKVRDGRSWRT